MNKYYYYLLLPLLLFTYESLLAQDITQTVRGTVYDRDTRQPLSGASVVIRDLDPAVGAVTDNQGRFRLEQVPVGRYILRATFVGYETFTVPDMLVQTGKETILEIALTQSARNLEEVVVQGTPETLPETIEPISSRSFSVEETRRFAATFFDPARLATSFPGVVGVNDQANHISVRGNSPNSLLWRLEGIDIVNPNHLSNAGTFSDRRVQNSGSQSVLSMQVLGNSTFLTGAFPASYGNALGGIFDMRLRKGNNEQREYTAQVGVIGLEFAAEGPFKEGKNSSYLINYRYSTVGLLTSGLGLDFGGEDISFQDLSFNLYFPTRKGGEFTIFGVGGTGSNIFQATRDSTTWEEQKDRYDITFTNDMGVLGFTHSLPLGKTLLKTTVAASALNSDRYADVLTGNNYATERLDTDRYLEMRISATSSFTRKLTNNNSLTAGFFLDHLYYNLSSAAGQLNTATEQLIEGAGGGLLFRPYVQGKWMLGRQLTANAGLHYTYFAFNGTQSLDPRASLRWQTNAFSTLTFAYGLHSQLQLPGVYFYSEPPAGGGIANPNANLGLTKAHHYVLSYDRLLGETASFRAETYYQQLFNVPVALDPSSTFSALNLFEGFVNQALTNEGTGQNYGLELTLEKSLSDSYYFLLSSSLYESRYTAADGVERDTRFNGNYAFSATAGKEFSWNKPDKKRVFGINLRGVYVGGLRASPIDEAASREQQTTVFDESNAFTQQWPAYFKVDLRLSLRMNKAAYSSELSLDLQNALNRRNIAFRYYDAVAEDFITQYQLGLIPILTYRVEF